MIAGIYSRSSADGSLNASLAVLDGQRVIEHITRRADSDPTTSGFYESLRRDAQELLERHRPSRVVLWQLGPVLSGVSGGFRAASPGIRAEGALLCAVEAVGLATLVIERDTLLKISGQRRVGDAVASLTRELDPPTGNEIAGYAAAAARAVQLRG